MTTDYHNCNWWWS